MIFGGGMGCKGPRPRRYLFTAAIATLAVTLLLGGCQLPNIRITPLGRVQPALSSTAQPLRIGAAVTLSGAQRQTGAALMAGYDLWARQVNAAGGLLGRPVELIIYDDAGDPRRAGRLYMQLIGTNQVDLLLGPSAAESAATAAAAAAARHRPILTMAGAQAGAPWAISLPHSEQLPGGALLDLAKAQDYRRVAIVSYHEGPNLESARTFSELAAQKGLEVVSNHQYPVDGSGLGQLVTTIRSSDPDLMVVLLPPVPTRTFMRRVQEAGYRPAMTALLGRPALADLASDLGAEAIGLLTEVPWHPTVNSEKARGLAAAYAALHQGQPDYPVAAGYALGQMLEYAVQSAGTVDGAALLEALLAGGAATVLDIGSQTAAGVIVQYQEQGPAAVWPASAAAAELQLPPFASSTENRP